MLIGCGYTLEAIHFCMCQTVLFMEALPDYAIVVYKYSTNHRIGFYILSSELRQLKTALDIYFICLHNCESKKAKIKYVCPNDAFRDL